MKKKKRKRVRGRRRTHSSSSLVLAFTNSISLNLTKLFSISHLKPLHPQPLTSASLHRSLSLKLSHSKAHTSLILLLSVSLSPILALLLSNNYSRKIQAKGNSPSVAATVMMDPKLHYFASLFQVCTDFWISSFQSSRRSLSMTRVFCSPFFRIRLPLVFESLH